MDKKDDGKIKWSLVVYWLPVIIGGVVSWAPYPVGLAKGLWDKAGNGR